MGGINNATTSYDRTNYFETLPSQYLNTLEFEADRMRHAYCARKITIKQL